MNLDLFDEKLNRVLIIGSRFISCLWSEGYNSAQPFTLELPAKAEYKEKIHEDMYIGRWDRDSLMVIKGIEYHENKIIVKGFQALRCLDDVAFIGTIPENSEIDTAIINAYNQSSRYPEISIEPSNLGIRYDSQISHKSIMELAEIMCQDGDIGFRVMQIDGKIKGLFYKPEKNPNLVFAEVVGNLNNAIIQKSVSIYKNYAIVLGAGEGESRIRVDVDKSRGKPHREIIIDASDLQQEQNESLTQYKKRLYARGKEKLRENNKIFNIDFQPLAKEFGTKFDLGDIITVYMPEYDLTFESRIIRMTQKAQKNQTITTLDVGETKIIKR